MKINENYIATMIDGVYHVIPIGDAGKKQNGVFEMNGTASEIFGGIEAGKKEEQIVADLVSRYPDSEPDTVRAYVSDFLKKLSEAGIIEDD